MKTLWQKNNSDDADRSFFHEFTTSEDRTWDHHLIPYDILVNLAQSRMLRRINIYTDSELIEVTRYLQKLYNDWKEDNFTLSDEDEDVHSATEKNLTERVGEPGQRINTGRSRNDQVLADIHLALKAELRKLTGLILDTISRLDQIAQKHRGIFFAGMTHTQPAMPTSVDAWAAGYIRMMLNDLQSIQHAYRQIDVCPLGSAAGYGVPHIAIDREFLSDQLGFSQLLVEVNATQNIRTSSVLRVIHALEYYTLTCNRMSSDIIEFLRSGLIELDENQTSGSSIMPQKQNPDLWELIRSGYHQVSGAGRELSGISVNLTSGYHRDLQPVKAVILNSIKQTQTLAEATEFGLNGLSFNEEASYSSITSEVMATHHANKLVSEGKPFREAYRETSYKFHNITLPDIKVLQESYHHTGAPGKYPQDVIREETEMIQSWLSDEEKKWDEVVDKLMN